MRTGSLRGELLEFLKIAYPGFVLELDIIGVFYRDWRDTQIRQDLAYLVDRGYVERIKKPHPVKQRRVQAFYKLTADGVDLIDGIAVDPGVLIEGDC